MDVVRTLVGPARSRVLSVLGGMIAASCIAPNADKPSAPVSQPEQSRAQVAKPVASDSLAAAQCKALEYVSFEKAAESPARVISAEYIVAAPVLPADAAQYDRRGESQGMPSTGVTELPAHCRVEGYVSPNVEFLALLPDESSWSNDVLYAACDAFCGAVQDDMPVPGLLRGFAALTTDGGHVNRRPFDGIWAYNNRQGEIDFGFRASHVGAQMIKALAAEYYDRPHEFAFIAGFSKGGSAGVKAALTYPEDFDGVLARAPVVRYQEINAIRLPWIYKAMTRDDGTPIVVASEIALIHSAAIASCDAVDGLEDGAIDDPRACSFDPTVLLCEPGAGPEDCLTQEQVDALNQAYDLPRGGDGSVVYPYPLEVGSELDWPRFHVSADPNEMTFGEEAGSTYLRYMAFDDDPGPDFDWKSFDAAVDGDKLDALRQIYDADSVELDEFRAAGGKMMILHGWGDGAVSARMSIDWYERLLAADSDASEYVRLFLMPGVKHGSGGDGPGLNESMDALRRWVREGAAPEELLLKKLEAGEVVRTRPTYAYPKRAVYRGTGSIDEAENFGPSPD